MTPQPQQGTLILIRHGQSTANLEGMFTGVLNVELTPFGCAESRNAAGLVRAQGFTPGAVFTSSLRRAIESARLILDGLRRPVLPVEDWRLNERNYGALTARTKVDVREEYGEAQFVIWRRSVDGRPPPLGSDLFTRLATMPPFSRLPLEALARTESLRDVIARVRPFYTDVLLPLLREGQTVLVVAHGNSLRALCAVLDDLSDTEVRELNIPTGQPLVYQPASSYQRSPRGGRYLDPTTASAAALALASQGGT